MEFGYGFFGIWGVGYYIIGYVMYFGGGRWNGVVWIYQLIDGFVWNDLFIDYLYGVDLYDFVFVWYQICGFCIEYYKIQIVQIVVFNSFFGFLF